MAARAILEWDTNQVSLVSKSSSFTSSLAFLALPAHVSSPLRLATEVDAILLSCDAERQKALNGTMNNASNLKRILENSKNQRVLPPPPSMTIDESAIQSGEAKLSKLRLDLQCEEWGRSGAIYGNSQGEQGASN